LKKRTKKLLSIWFSGTPAVVRTRKADESFQPRFSKKNVALFIGNQALEMPTPHPAPFS
jgi:hypothetical protein